MGPALSPISPSHPRAMGGAGVTIRAKGDSCRKFQGTFFWARVESGPKRQRGPESSVFPPTWSVKYSIKGHFATFQMARTRPLGAQRTPRCWPRRWFTRTSCTGAFQPGPRRRAPGAEPVQSRAAPRPSAIPLQGLEPGPPPPPLAGLWNAGDRKRRDGRNHLREEGGRRSQFQKRREKDGESVIGTRDPLHNPLSSKFRALCCPWAPCARQPLGHLPWGPLPSVPAHGGGGNGG